MIALDTNVISELFLEAPDTAVLRWFESQNANDLFITSITEAELLRGVSILPDGRRKSALLYVITQMLERDFENRILAFDTASAKHYADIFSKRQTVGRPISAFDCMIAATAKALRFTVATRNVKDFEGCGIEIVNPWQL
jgi:toxin FitB